MKPRKFRLENPFLTEFIYSCLYNTSFDEKKVIPPRLLKYVRDLRMAKKFLKNYSLDEAVTLLSYLGIGHAFFLFDKKNGTLKSLQAILDKHKTNKPISALQDVVDGHFFVSTDKEFNMLLGLMGQTIAHKSYDMGLEYTRVGHHIHNWPRRLDLGADDPVPDMMLKSNLLATTLLSSSLTLEKALFLFGLRPLEVQILLYLYPLKHTYANISQLSTYFTGYVPHLKVIGAVKSLINSQHIQPSAIARDQEYTISALGIRVVNQYMEAAIHGSHFR